VCDHFIEFGLGEAVVLGALQVAGQLFGVAAVINEATVIRLRSRGDNSACPDVAEEHVVGE
jgi:hypothetical protein